MKPKRHERKPNVVLATDQQVQEILELVLAMFPVTMDRLGTDSQPKDDNGRLQ